MELKDLESELYDGSEDYSNDREYRDDDEKDDGDLSYIETGQSVAAFNVMEPGQHTGSTLPDDVTNFNYVISDDSDEEKDYMALRKLVLYGGNSLSGVLFTYFSTDVH